MTDADDNRVRKAIQGVEFPASKATLINYAEQRSADPKTMRALWALPNGDYGNNEQVTRATPQRPEQTSPNQ